MMCCCLPCNHRSRSTVAPTLTTIRCGYFTHSDELWFCWISGVEYNYFWCILGPSPAAGWCCAAPTRTTSRSSMPDTLPIRRISRSVSVRAWPDIWISSLYVLAIMPIYVLIGTVAVILMFFLHAKFFNHFMILNLIYKKSLSSGKITTIILSQCF